MIRLKKPFLWEGRIIPAEETVSLPAEMEKRIVFAKNGESVTNSAKEPEPGPDGSTDEQAKKAAEKAEKPSATEADPGLNLGRPGPAR